MGTLKNNTKCKTQTHETHFNMNLSKRICIEDTNKNCLKLISNLYDDKYCNRIKN